MRRGTCRNACLALAVEEVVPAQSRSTSTWSTTTGYSGSPLRANKKKSESETHWRKPRLRGGTVELVAHEVDGLEECVGELCWLTLVFEWLSRTQGVQFFFIEL